MTGLRSRKLQLRILPGTLSSDITRFVSASKSTIFCPFGSKLEATRPLLYNRALLYHAFESPDEGCILNSGSVDCLRHPTTIRGMIPSQRHPLTDAWEIAKLPDSL